MKLFHIRASESYTAKPEQSQFSSHTHDTYEIFYFISGNAEYSVEGNITYTGGMHAHNQPC